MYSGRVDESNYELRRRRPQKPSEIRSGHNHFYVTKKTSIPATVKRIEEMLNNKENEVTDDLFPLSDEFEMGIRHRPLSAIHIHICRAQS
ncbi:hypothetical protein KIN20_004985 [Parelaphostrongylus tenuis]|uniref:Uncharacterized protein n=1 Tax=Parelaphostrongylus tenuis TaxID=148309 RepID=A0AAD5MI62_PARTN|nr:hypothetical protein KIN20_004985 [Parelaphostrongylus tenuis]